VENVKKQLSDTGKKLIEKNLVAGPGGNISAREGNYVYLSPSGFSLNEIGEKEWVQVNLKTGRINGKLRPTCEISMHLGIYAARKDVNAVVHTHPALTIGLISAGIKFKPLCPDYVAVLGRDVPVIPYVKPGGQEIRQAVVKEIKKADVVLLKNHGVVCVGETLKEAFTRSWIVEEISKSIIAGKIAGDKLIFLNRKDVEEIENMEAEDYRKALLKNSRHKTDL
jgi:L-fuculose-phosphate aldolase